MTAFELTILSADPEQRKEPGFISLVRKLLIHVRQLHRRRWDLGTRREFDRLDLTELKDIGIERMHGRLGWKYERCEAYSPIPFSFNHSAFEL